ncbi:hypothetical protein Zmor_004857 [Zophobas morio]|uniref:SCY1-like protein 2 n=1 Tax=Zophobas morio TaxID=2755281 RepID=A0AA38IMY5_9CUCU|nr:hypothetical protein Zmor_004857 [Zophobas morio]
MQIPLTKKATLLQECSVFLFEKRCAEKLHKPKRKETVTEILRSSVRQLERFRHPKILHVLHPIEECAETLAFASEPVFASLANILAHQEGSGNHGGITATGASQQPAVRSAYAREYNFLDIEYKYGILQVSEREEVDHVDKFSKENSQVYVNPWDNDIPGRTKWQTSCLGADILSRI